MFHPTATCPRNKYKSDCLLPSWKSVSLLTIAKWKQKPKQNENMLLPTPRAPKKCHSSDSWCCIHKDISCCWLNLTSPFPPLGLCVYCFLHLKCSSSALSMASSFYPIGLSLIIPSSERPPMTTSAKIILSVLNCPICYHSVYILHRHYHNKIHLVH